jgi:large subunit ribosomal protein L21
MYAVILDRRGAENGKQYLVREGERVRVDLMDAEPGQKVVFDHVLFVGGADGVKAGRPLVAGAKVEAVVLAETQGAKLVVFHKRRRKFMRRRNGHRQRFTDLKVERIG